MSPLRDKGRRDQKSLFCNDFSKAHTKMHGLDLWDLPAFSLPIGVAFSLPLNYSAVFWATFRNERSEALASDTPWQEL